MSWKCGICDTYNDDRVPVCYVCGQHRSAESIRAGKIRAREERVLRVDNAIYQKGYNISKIIFFVGLLLSLSIVVIATIIKISGGDVDSIVANLAKVGQHTIERTSLTVPNIQSVLLELKEAPIGDIGSNTGSILNGWENTLSSTPFVTREIFLNNAKNNVEYCYTNCIELLAASASDNLSRVFSTIDEIWIHATKLLGNIETLAESVVENIKEYF